MKFVTFSKNGKQYVGVLSADEKQIYDIQNLGFDVGDMEDLIRRLGSGPFGVAEAVAGAKGIAIDEVKIEAPIPTPSRDVICLGINYTEHAKESARYKKDAFVREDYPIFFSKRVRKAVADGEGIPAYEGLVEALDYEVELAVIIGKDAYKVDEKDAFDYVFGYTIVNDVSARKLQTRHKQWFFGKSLDGFCPMGPCIVTKDEFENPPELKISAKVNGEVRQDSNTNLLVFSIAKIISDLSQGMILEAGTIIATGTPAGVGMGFEPPKFLKVGDVVECEIEGIGKITNTVVKNISKEY